MVAKELQQVFLLTNWFYLKAVELFQGKLTLKAKPKFFTLSHQKELI